MYMYDTTVNLCHPHLALTIAMTTDLRQNHVFPRPNFPVGFAVLDEAIIIIGLLQTSAGLLLAVV